MNCLAHLIINTFSLLILNNHEFAALLILSISLSYYPGENLFMLMLLPLEFYIGVIKDGSIKGLEPVWEFASYRIGDLIISDELLNSGLKKCYVDYFWLSWAFVLPLQDLHFEVIKFKLGFLKYLALCHCSNFFYEQEAVKNVLLLHKVHLTSF